MLKFLRLGNNVGLLSEYMEQSEIEFCDYSVGAKYLWRDEFIIEYALFNDTLIMKETCKDYSTAFYYPIGKDVDGAFLEIEKYCKQFGRNDSSTRKSSKYLYFFVLQLDIIGILENYGTPNIGCFNFNFFSLLVCKKRTIGVYRY